jgi:hypothetical protein
MKRPLLLACLVFLPSLSGCIFPYVGPSIAYTPSVKLDVPRDEVRAFRVDIASSQDSPGWYGPFLSQTNQERLSEVPISHRDEVPSQLKASVQHGIVIIGVLSHRIRESESVVVRLYRSGFDLVEVGSWEGRRRVEWKPAVDVAAQEKAVDQLFGGRQDGPRRPAARFGCWQAKGSTSAAHRDAILFGASEYERLANLPASTAGEREVLRDKAKALRVVADE